MSTYLMLERELAAITGRRWVSCSAAARAAYAYDSGTSAARPDLIVLPGSREEVRQTLLACHRLGVRVVPRGAGTCLSGGPVPVQGGVVVALTRLNRILSLDPANQVAVVEPGVLNAELGRAAEGHGLAFMPDPASMQVATLGGNAAENAGGPRAVRYGSFGRHLLGAEYMLVDGTTLTAGQLDGVPCPDLPRPVLELGSVLVGSEGTLALLTRLALRLTPLPVATSTILALFAHAEAAGRAVAALGAAGLALSAVEIMGSLDIRLAEEYLSLGLPAGTGAMLLLEIAGPEPGLARQVGQAAQIAEQAGARQVESATSPEDRERLWRARRASSGLYGRVRPAYVSGDITVPLRSLGIVFQRIEELEASSGLPIGVIGHAGDGNLHPAVLFDPADPAEIETAHQVNAALVREALQLGGSISGEHGVGSEKLSFMAQAFEPPALRYFTAIKRAFDPAGRLNPGKVLPDKVPAADQPVATAGSPGLIGTAGLVGLGGLYAEHLLTATRDLAGYGFGGQRRPTALALPHDTEEVAAVVRGAVAAGLPVWPVGSGGLVGSAMGPFQGGLALTTARLQRVIEIWPGDLTCRIEAGCTGADLTVALRATAGPGERHPWYPIDPWRAPRATLGGEIATNAVGPGRPGYGSTRDRILGLTFVDPRGEICRVGGQTIKNVAGYDVSRLLCGSWGALGVITEITLRLEPPPECRHTLAICSVSLSRLAEAAEGIRRVPGLWALELVAPALSGHPWQLLAGLAGQAEDVAASAADVAGCARVAGAAAAPLASEAAAAAWDRVRVLRGPALCRAWQVGHGSWVAGYVAVPPTALGKVVAALHQGLGAVRNGASLTACWPCGTVDFGMRASSEDEASGSAMLREVAAALAAAIAAGGVGGESGFYGMSDDLNAETSTDYSPDASALITRLKTELDPAWLLAPAARLLPPRAGS